MVVAVGAQPKPPIGSPPACMIWLRHVGSFWLNTGTPHGEPLALGDAAGPGETVRAALAAPAPVSGDGPTGPAADCTPWRRPICPAAVQHSDAEWPRANTSTGSSVTFCGGSAPSVRAAHTSNAAGRPSAGARPIT